MPARFALALCSLASLFALALPSARAAAPEDTAPEDAAAVDTAYIKEHYTKYEYKIPMRDGVHLFTAAYVPKDSTQTYPILLQRTPYSLRPYGESNFPTPRGPMKAYAKDRFIFAYQDVRGRNASEGTFVHVRPHNPSKGPKDVDESSDTFDTIDWLTKRVPSNNGRVGLAGISYPGFYAAAGAIDAHPALKCVSPQAPVTDWFIGDDFRHNGALYLAHSFRFLSFFGQPLQRPTRQSAPPFDYETPNGYEFYLKLGRLDEVAQKHFEKGLLFWNELLEHDTYDAFWKARLITPHLKNIRPAMLTVGGWFDAEDLYGPLHVYRAAENASPGATNLLVMGPWSHGGWHAGDGDRLGHVSFDQKSADFYRRQIELPFYNHHLKAAPDPKLPEAYVFETGTNHWRRYDAWPPKNTVAKTLYFEAGGKLSFAPPAGSSASSRAPASPGATAGSSSSASSASSPTSHQPPATSPSNRKPLPTPPQPHSESSGSGDQVNSGRKEESRGQKTPSATAGSSISASSTSHQPLTTDHSHSSSYDEYVSDPAKPVPFIPNIAIGMTDEHMLDDQRFASTRTDVLVYVSDPLTEDVTIAGPITPRLFVSTTGTDSDFVVKLIDVYSGDFPNPSPNPSGVQLGGYQQLVRGEVMRGKFRKSFEHPEPFEPNKVTEVTYEMPDAYHTFRRGHRIMVHVQSSWFPLVDRNPQQFMEIHKAEPGDFQKATQRVYRAPETPSAVQIQVLP